jgi:toxin ParE1/3/4
MKLEYTKLALADLRKVAADSQNYGESVAVAVEKRINGVVARIARHPESAALVAGRPGMRVIPLIRYPYKILALRGVVWVSSGGEHDRKLCIA